MVGWARVRQRLRTPEDQELEPDGGTFRSPLRDGSAHETWARTSRSLVADRSTAVSHAPRAMWTSRLVGRHGSSVPTMIPPTGSHPPKDISPAQDTQSAVHTSPETVSGGTSESADGAIRNCTADNSPVASNCPSQCRQTRGREIMRCKSMGFRPFHVKQYAGRPRETGSGMFHVKQYAGPSA